MSASKERILKSLTHVTSLTSEITFSKEIRSMLDVNDHGLGYRFMEKLSQFKDKIQQVDASYGVTETYGALRIRAVQVACEMKSRGIKDNDIVVICSASHSDQTVAVLATLFLAAIVAPLDVDLTSMELKACIVSLKPKMAFCDVRVTGILEVICRTTPEIPSFPIVVFGDYTDRVAFERFLLNKPDSEFQAVRIEDTKRAVAFIVPTQGTTGPLKLVCISHRAIFIQITVYAEIILKGVETVLSFFPLCWITQVLIFCYCLEASVIRVLAGQFSERSAFRLSHDLNIDCAFLGTEYALRMIKHYSMEDYDISRLKLIYVGGIMTTASDMMRLRKAFKTAKVIQCYGLTEMTCLVTTFEQHEYEKALENIGSVGKLLPYIRAKIVDPATKETVSVGSSGELTVSGPTMMLGYFKDVNGTELSLEKKYFKTGDYAQFDSYGNLYIEGRISNHKLHNGQRFFPTEIEEMLKTNPKVQETVVIGQENEIVAFIVRQNETLTAEELTNYIEMKLPINKRPTIYKFLPSIPKTPAGKIRNSVISQELGLSIVYSKSIVSFGSAN